MTSDTTAIHPDSLRAAAAGTGHAGSVTEQPRDDRTVPAQRWLDDLDWHRHTYRPSKVMWEPERVARVATSYTFDRIDYESITDLAYLSRMQTPLRDVVDQVRAAAAPLLLEASTALGGPGWEPVARALLMSPVECREAVEAARNVTIGEHAQAAVDQALTFADGVLSNPLIKAWELRAMWLMHQAAHDLLEDTLCDLVVELKPRHSMEELALAVGERDSFRLDNRVAIARQARGAPGDQRRIPVQQRIVMHRH